MSNDFGTAETAAARADYLVADAVLRNRSRTGASCRGAPARGHTGLQLYIFSVGLAVASRATTRRQIVSWMSFPADALIRAVFEGNCVVQVSLEDIVPSFLKDEGRRICLTYVK